MTAQEKLKASKLSVTAQRIAILDAVTANPHCTADLVIKEVKSELGKVSKQAVYDTLHLLSEKEIIRCIQPSGFPSIFEARVKDNHHHLICRECNETHDVDCAVGHAPCLTPKEDFGFLVDEAEVIYWGYCPACLEKMKAKKSLEKQ